MNDSLGNEFYGRNEDWAQWQRRVELTESESEQIRSRIMDSLSSRSNDVEKLRLSRQLARMNRIVAFSNRSNGAKAR